MDTKQTYSQLYFEKRQEDKWNVLWVSECEWGVHWFFVLYTNTTHIIYSDTAPELSSDIHKSTARWWAETSMWNVSVATPRDHVLCSTRCPWLTCVGRALTVQSHLPPAHTELGNGLFLVKFYFIFSSIKFPVCCNRFFVNSFLIDQSHCCPRYADGVKDLSLIFRQCRTYSTSLLHITNLLNIIIIIIYFLVLLF